MKKKLISAIVLLSVMLTLIFAPAYAKTEKKEETKDKNENSQVSENKLDLKSKGAILIHYDSGMTLYEEGADKKCYPASTTKIMTAILALENLSLDAELTASPSAIDIARDGSNIGILIGEKLSVEQLLCALLIHSANDAANMLAEAVSGSIDDFVVLMNKKAQELGMENTHFENPHGYYSENHYTTARDMAKLAVYAMKNEKFAEIVSVPNMELPPTALYPQVRYLISNNMLINPQKGSKYLYEGAKGIKTGHTEKSGYSFVSFAERNSVSFICVVMGSPVEYEENYSFKDTITLLDYGYQNYKVKTISNVGEVISTSSVKWAKGGKQAILTAKDSLSLLLPASFDPNKLETKLEIQKKVKAPLKKDDVLGKMKYIYNGEMLGEINLVVKDDIPKSYIRMIFGSIFGVIFSGWFMGTIAGIFVILFAIRTYNLRKRRKRREMLRRKARRDFYKR